MSGYNVKIDKNVQSEQNIVREFKAGLHDNVTLSSVEFKSINEKINNNEPVLVFNFVGVNQEVYNFIEYPVDFTRDDAEKKALNQGIRIKHILTKFIDEDSINLTDATSYADFANKVINTLGDKHKNVKVAIKLVYKTVSSKRVEFTSYKGFIANNILDLKIGKDEIIVKPQPQPTADPLGEDLGADDMNLNIPPSSDTPF